MGKWQEITVGKFMQFNPNEKLSRNTVAKKVPMEKLTVNERKISGFEIAEYNGGAKFKNGDTLLAKITPCLENGKTAQVDILNEDEIGFGSTEFIVLRENENSVNDYIYYLAKSPLFRKKAISCMEGTSGRKRVDEGALKLQLIKVPDSINTQRKIAAVLSSFDNKIELNNRINTELEAMAKTLYDYWFVQFDFPDANGKPYKSSGGKMVWNEELKREIPEGWEVNSLWSIADYTNGLAMQKHRPKEGEKSFRVIKIREMNDGFSDDSELATTNLPERVIVHNGDILFSWSASLDVMIWTRGIGALNQHIFKVTSKKFPKSFYYYQLLNYLQHFKMIAENRKTTMGHITKDHLLQSKIAIPPHELTVELDKLIQPLFAKKINNDVQNQHLTELRDWLLPMLMNGQVKVAEGAIVVEKIEEPISIAAEPAAVYVTQPQVLNIPESKKPFAKRVLGGKIVSLFKDDPHFTHIKFQKLQFLAEHIAGADIKLNYYYKSAGPYDPSFMNTVANKLKESGWYEERNYKFIPLGKQGQIEGYYEGFFKPATNRLNQLFSLLSNKTVAETEIIATVYAVWNNRIIKQQPVSDELITEDFYNWSERKLGYTPERIEAGLQWLRTNGFTPTGFGKELKRRK